jgi:hypothetical protein
MMRLIALVFALAFGLAPAAEAQMPSTPGAKVFFVNLKDGEHVKSPFKIEFGITGMTLAKAGYPRPGTGHHHLLIDTTITPEDLTDPIPADAQHIHFGGGDTETTLSLAPGKHTLQLLLADWRHVALTPPVMSEKITVVVE